SGHAMMRFIDLGIGVQPRVVHDAVDKVIDDGSNRIDAPKPVIERFLGRRFLTGNLMCHVSHSLRWKMPTPATSRLSGASCYAAQQPAITCVYWSTPHAG